MVVYCIFPSSIAFPQDKMLVSNASSRPDCPVELIDVDHARRKDLGWMNQICCIYMIYGISINVYVHIDIIHIYIYMYDNYR